MQDYCCAESVQLVKVLPEGTAGVDDDVGVAGVLSSAGGLVVGALDGDSAEFIGSISIIS